MHFFGIALFGFIALFWLTYGLRVAHGAISLRWVWMDLGDDCGADCFEFPCRRGVGDARIAAVRADTSVGGGIVFLHAAALDDGDAVTGWNHLAGYVLPAGGVETRRSVVD